MGDGKDGHFKADQRVDEGERHVFRVGIRSHLLDCPEGDEEGDTNALPEREEQDALDAEEFGCARQLRRTYKILYPRTGRKGLRSS